MMSFINKTKNFSIEIIKIFKWAFYIILITVALTVLISIICNFFNYNIDVLTAINVAFTLILAIAPITAIVIEFSIWKKNKRAPLVEEFMKAKLTLFMILLVLSLTKEILSVLDLSSHLVLNQALFGITMLVACDRVLSYAKAIHEEKKRRKKKMKEMKEKEEKEKLDAANLIL